MALFLIDKNLSQMGLLLAKTEENARVVLIQDGVFIEVSRDDFLPGTEIFYVENDLAKRGIENIPEGSRMINYDELIDLIENEKIYNFI
jgi:sulfur relay protein TusB/DsrH